jgi:hypothetical protein
MWGYLRPFLSVTYLEAAKGRPSMLKTKYKGRGIARPMLAPSCFAGTALITRIAKRPMLLRPSRERQIFP